MQMLVAKKLEPSEFVKWLWARSEQDNPIGDLASDTKRDSTFPVAVDNYVAFRGHLVKKMACWDALEAAEEAWKRFEHNRSAVVYFVQVGSDGPIKIGRTASLEKRLSSLQTSHWQTLNLLAVQKGGAELEKELHKKFDAYRQVGEWFMPHAELLAHVAGVNDEISRR